ncbi:MAG: hypothetical protein JXK05_03280 [Campylobacterales bacterium]|nr:hypothetical protein [Campylobacterales bacterium]
MFDLDLIITFAIMALLFLRQIAIYKEPGKINYTPLLLGIGAIGSMSHILLHPEHNNIAVLLREALLPLLFGLLLYLIMNVLHQTQKGLQQAQHDLTLRSVAEQFEEINKNTQHTDIRLRSLQQMEEQIAKTMEKFISIDFSALKSIETNQVAFFGKFEVLFEQQQEVLKSFENFTNQKMPDVDAVMHRHIDLLRIAEQDHYKHLQKGFSTLIEAQKGLNDAFERMADKAPSVQLDEGKLKEIVLKTDTLLQQVVNDFERQMIALRAQSEGIATAMAESDHLITTIRTQEQEMLSQMIAGAKQLQHLWTQSDRLQTIYAPIEQLAGRMERIREDYAASKLRLDMLTDSLQSIDTFQFEKIRSHIESLTQTLSERIDASLSELHEHYNIAQKDITKTVQELSTKARLSRGYGEDHSA